ncbi:hypothetical protein KSP39_PZI022229 [Platanthera zijinensis]|uniref:Retrotransposon gag domain-containing protein n=1 Tax=Platanthera zijinensis TaxID=2320716 RepID=A0AAP0FUY1_9ASPA
MKVLYESQDFWHLVEDGVDEPKDANTLSTKQLTDFKEARKKDKKALYFIYQSVDEVIFERIASAKTSKEAWDTLHTAYRGEEKVKLVRLQTLRCEFDTMKMKDSESIEEFFNRVVALTNKMLVNGEAVENKKVIEKILRSLPRKFENVVVTIEESKDLSTLTLESLMGSLQSHELRMKQYETIPVEQAFQTQLSMKQGKPSAGSMTGEEGQGSGRGSPPPPPPPPAASVSAELREEILGLVRTALGMRAESATPVVPVVAAPALGDDAPLRRPGKEPAERGEREFQGRVLFPGSAAEYHFGETAGREFPPRPAEGGSPFSEFVSSAPVPEGFREPEMTYYSGKGDPVHQIQWFEDMVSIRQMSDGFKCRLFAITLREKAREWFHQLPTGSIYCFEDLRRGFMLRFTTSKKRKKEVESLFRVKQRVGETLGSYLDRFQEELSQVQEMPGHTMMVAFTLGLQSGFFAMELKRSPPVSFEALLERAAREADMEAAHPEFARRLARWAVEEERPRGGRGQEERRVEPRQREQPPPQQHQQQPRQGRHEPNFRLGWRPEWQEPGARRGFRGGDYRQGGQGQFYPPGGMQGQRPALPDQEQAMAIALGERRRAIRRRRREVGVELPYCDFHQEEGHATATCPEFLEMRGNREQQ